MIKTKFIVGYLFWLTIGFAIGFCGVSLATDSIWLSVAGGNIGLAIVCLVYFKRATEWKSHKPPRRTPPAPPRPPRGGLPLDRIDRVVF